jgi:hypothetical protein
MHPHCSATVCFCRLSCSLCCWRNFEDAAASIMSAGNTNTYTNNCFAQFLWSGCGLCTSVLVCGRPTLTPPCTMSQDPQCPSTTGHQGRISSWLQVGNHKRLASLSLVFKQRGGTMLGGPVPCCPCPTTACLFRSFQPKSEPPAVPYRVITAMGGLGTELGGVNSKPKCHACILF